MINNNIQESYCSFEVSKLLKEKGFRIPVNSVYFPKDNIWGPSKRKSLPRGDYNTKTVAHIGYGISRPTHSIVIEWIRINFGYFIQSLHRGDIGEYTFKVSVLKQPLLKIKKEPHYISEQEFNSPQEATEAALLYTLTNLV